MTYEIPSPVTDPEHPVQLDRYATGSDFRRRQLALFRQRQHEAEPEESR